MELIEPLSKLAKFRKFDMFFRSLPENGLPSQTTQGAKNMEKLNLPQKQTKTCDGDDGTYNKGTRKEGDDRSLRPFAR